MKRVSVKSAKKTIGRASAPAIGFGARPRYVTTRQAAKLCGVSVFTIQRWFDKGYLSGAKTPGGRRRLSPESLDEFMRKQGMAPSEGRNGLLHRVLLVDDDTRLLSTLKDALAVGERYHIRTASSCLEGGMILSKYQPDTLVLDVMLEDRPGSELVHRVREELGSKMRIIAISGRSSPADIKEVLDAGANVYISKPFTVDKLIKAIEGRVTGKI